MAGSEIAVTNGDTLAVALSTLAVVAALFQPTLAGVWLREAGR